MNSCVDILSVFFFSLYYKGNTDYSGFRISRELEHSGASLEYVGLINCSVS